jgi:glycosyltransferase involved in cell wall biosynthesis
LEKFEASDSRIKLFRNNTQKGLTKNLNYLLAKIKGKFVARMDADDICLPHRFDRQLKVLNSERADICGCWIRVFSNSYSKITKYPITDKEIRTELLFQTALAHPAVMLKSAIFKQGLKYDETLETSQDYDLWVRSAKFAKFYNIPEVLLYYRKHVEQISSIKKIKQWENGNIVRGRYFKILNLRHSHKQFDQHNLIRKPEPLDNIMQLLQLESWIHILIKNSQLSNEVILKNWFLLCIRCSHFGFRVFREFFKLMRRQKQSLWNANTAVLAMLCMFRIKYRSRLYNFFKFQIINLFWSNYE